MMQNRRTHAGATPGALRVTFMPDPSLSVEPCSYCRENSALNAAQQARRCARVATPSDFCRECVIHSGRGEARFDITVCYIKTPPAVRVPI